MGGDLVDQVASATWERTLARSPYLQVQRGLPVTRLPAGSPAEVAEDAAFARTQLKLLAAADMASLDPPRAVTVGVLRALLEEQAREEDYWFSFPVTPYATFGLSAYTGQIFAPFKFAGREDVDRYLQLVRDF